MVDKISNISKLVQTLRTRLDNNKISKATSSEKKTQSEGKDNPEKLKKLETVIINRIKKLDRDDEKFERNAQKIIIESLLVRQFGEAILEDNNFSDLVFKIMEDINSDKTIQNKFSVFSETIFKRVSG